MNREYANIDEMVFDLEKKVEALEAEVALLRETSDAVEALLLEITIGGRKQHDITYALLQWHSGQIETETLKEVLREALK